MANDINLSDLSKFLQERASKINDNLAIKIKLCCQKVVDDIKYDMAHTPRNMSKTYYTNNKTKAHHPSLPENPPAPDSGNLRENTIKYELVDTDNELYGIVGTTQKDPDYGLYLEYGTSDGRIAPRPWLRPTMRKNNDFIRRELAKAVANTLTGASK